MVGPYSGPKIYYFNAYNNNKHLQHTREMIDLEVKYENIKTGLWMEGYASVCVLLNNFCQVLQVLAWVQGWV